MNVLLKTSTALGLALAFAQPAWADMEAAADDSEGSDSGWDSDGSMPW